MAMSTGCAAPSSALAFNGEVAGEGPLLKMTLPPRAAEEALQAVPDEALQADAVRRPPRSMLNTAPTIDAPF